MRGSTVLQWNLSPSGPAILSFVERLSSLRGDSLWSVYTCMRMSFIGRFVLFRSIRGSTVLYGLYTSVSFRQSTSVLEKYSLDSPFSPGAVFRIVIAVGNNNNT